jgi:hypothetical protein
MERNEGFTAALKLLDDRVFVNTLIVVRPSLVEAALRRWGTASATSSATSKTRVVLPSGDANQADHILVSYVENHKQAE